jgi:hypothetical protein
MMCLSHFSVLFFSSFEEPCYVKRHLVYVIFVGITQIILYAIGLPLLVFVFLWRHRDELKKPVVKFRYGLFFAGFRKETYYWECVVAMRKESTVLLAVFGPQMGVAMLAHVALLVFMVQILVQLIGHPYEAHQFKLQVLDVTSIVICWGTMWSGFFFYSPRPPSQKQALVFLTMLVVVVNVLYMAVLLYSMCSETCREHENNRVVKVFRRRTSNMKRAMKRRVSEDSFVYRRGTQHFENPTLRQEMVEIEMANRNSSRNPSRPETMPAMVTDRQERKKGTQKGSSAVSLGSDKKTTFMAAPPPAPTGRRIRLASITAKKTRFSNQNPMIKRSEKVTI